MIERRRHSRATVDLAAWLVWKHMSQTVVIRNIGARGVLIIAPGLELPVGDGIRVEFSLGRGQITVETKVRHCPRPGWMGVEFLGLPDEIAQEIERYVAARLRSSTAARAQA